MNAPTAPAGTARRLLPLLPAALVAGVGSSLILLALSTVAERLQHLLWTVLPDALGLSGSSWYWILATLTVIGVLVGVVVRFAPGHAGPDPATESLIGPPMAPRVLPGLAVTVVLSLAGGVSLGPENPITAINIALCVAIGTRIRRGSPVPLWLSLGAAGTVGALFGTPVAAALVLSEIPGGDPHVPLWDRLVAPLVAAGAGALTTVWLAAPVISIDVPGYPGFHLIDLVSGTVVAGGAAVLGLAAAYAFPVLHAAFTRIRPVVARIALAGLVLGLLGALGGSITLFKGLDEMKQLAADPDRYGIGALVAIVVIKLAALLVAASSGFRGGRIFPAVFIGVALGFLAHRIVPAVPVSLAIGCAVLGILVAITRQGWLSLFMAVTTLSDIRLLPVLCVLVLPVWLLASGRPEMLIRRPAGATDAGTPG